MELNKYIDHTYLKPFAMESDIIRICDEAKKYHFASVCVNPCNVPLVAKELAGSDVAVCSVVGFPFGTHTTKTKLFETREALDNGADEIDMVINVGRLIQGDEAYVEQEVAAWYSCAMRKEKFSRLLLKPAISMRSRLKPCAALWKVPMRILLKHPQAMVPEVQILKILSCLRNT